MPYEEIKQANRRNWNDRADVHAASGTYGLDRFRSDPGHLSDVVTFDRTRVGDVTAKRLVHLQCHIGTDTLSWARLGATVSGVDLSDRSIEVARELFADTGTDGRFACADVYDAPGMLEEPFDVVYTGVGAINWLPDLTAWADVVATMLASGGLFYIRDGHPLAGTLDDERGDDALVVRYPYFDTGQPMRWEWDGTYTDNGDGAIASSEMFEFPHSIADVISALLAAGLHITSFQEHRSLDWKMLPHMELGEDRLYRLPEAQRDLVPLMFSLTACKD